VLRGSGTARLCIAGQAPGKRVHESGIPFDDPSGKRLRRWMGIGGDVFYDESRIAIIPMGFCFPGYDRRGGDLPPRRECAGRWRSDIFAALPRLELILLVGAHAQRWHLGRRARPSLTETVRHWRDYTSAHGKGNVACLPLPHPSWRNNSWLKANPWFEAELVPALRETVRHIAG
jgi:uracil-DNA glycosylase